jgi:hypothetical protein
MAVGYGPAGILGLSPQSLVVNVVTRYVGLGPAGIAKVDRDFAAIRAASAAASGNVVARAAIARRAWSTVLVGAGVASAGILYHTVMAASHFQTMARQMQANSNLVGKEFQRMIGFSQIWAKKSGEDVEEVMAQYRRVTDYRIHGPRAEALTKTATKLALPTGAAPLDVQLALLRLGHTFQIPFNRQGDRKLAYMLHATTQLGSMNMEDVVRELPRFAQFARQYGGRGAAPDSLSAFAALSLAMSTPMAATQYTQFIRSIGAPSNTQYKRLQRLWQKKGINLFPYFGPQALKKYGQGGVIDAIRSAGLNEQEIAGLFPRMRAEGAAALFTTQPGRKDFEAIRRVVGGNEQARRQAGVSTPAELWTRYLGTSGAQAKILQQNIKMLSIELGKDLLPGLIDVTKWLTQATKNISLFNKEHPGVIKNVLEFSAAIGAGTLVLRSGIMMVKTYARIVVDMIKLFGVNGPVRTAVYMAFEGVGKFVKGIVFLHRLGKAALSAIVDFAKLATAATINAAKTWIAWLGANLKIAASFAKQKAILLAERARIILMAATMRVVTIATAIWEAAVWALNAAWAANPIGATILIIAALTLGIIWAYKNVKWFREGVNLAWKTIQDLGVWLKNNWKTVIIAALTAPFSIVLSTIILLWPKIKPAIKAIPGKIVDVFHAAKDGIWNIGVFIAKSIIGGLKDWWNHHNLKDFIGGKVSDMASWADPRKLFGGGASGRSVGSLPRGKFGMPVGAAMFAVSGATSITPGPANLAGLGYTHPAYHTDINVARGTPFQLPGGKKARWKLVQQYGTQGVDWGLTEVFQSPNGGQIDFMHMESMPNLQVNKWYSGGTPLGLTGGKPGVDATWHYSKNEHLHVGYDPLAYKYLYKVTGGRGFVPGRLNAGYNLYKYPAYATVPTRQPSTSGVQGGWLNSVRRYLPIIMAAANRFGIPWPILASIVFAESRGNPGARSFNPDENVWDIGLTQVGPAEARAGGGSYSYNPTKNIMAGAGYLAYLRKHVAGGNLPLAVAMYNAGPGNPAGGFGYQSDIYSRTKMGRRQVGGGAPGYQKGPPVRTKYGAAYRQTHNPPGYRAPATEAGLKNDPPDGHIEFGADGRPYMWHSAYDDAQGHHRKGYVLIKPHHYPGEMRYNEAFELQKWHNGHYINGVWQPEGWTTVKEQHREGQRIFDAGGQEYIWHKSFFDSSGEFHRRGYVPVPIKPGTEEYRRSGGGFELYRYYGPRMYKGQQVPPGWARVRTPYEKWQAQAVLRARRVGAGATGYTYELSQLRREYPMGLDLKQATPAEQQAWLAGQRRINWLKQQVDDARYTQAWIMGKITTPMYRALISREATITSEANRTAAQKLQQAKFGGAATATYQAYHIYRANQCAAEAQANKHRKKIEENTHSSNQHLARIAAVVSKQRGFEPHHRSTHPAPKQPVHGKQDERYLGYNVRHE